MTGILFGAGSLHAAEVTIHPERVLAVAGADWNGDGSSDRALLLISEKDTDAADLLIYVSEGTKPDAMRLAVSKRNIVWRGVMAGTQPSLEISARGSLIIVSGNEAIGRGRWTQKLTLAYVNKVFVVAGYTHVSRDTLDLDAHTACDVNLLTGSGTRNNKPFRAAAKAVAVTEWSDAAVPRECR